jgi:hypothetical protein
VCVVLAAEGRLAVDEDLLLTGATVALAAVALLFFWVLF